MSKEVKITENQVIIDDRTISVGDVLISRNSMPKTVTGFHYYVTDDGEKYLKVDCVYPRGINDELGESDIKNYYEVLKGSTVDQLKEKGDKVITGEATLEELFPKKSGNPGTDIMKMDKSVYERFKAEQERRMLEMKGIQSYIERKTDMMRRQCYNLIEKTNKLVSKLESIIFTLEIYGGIEETIEHLQYGQPASEDEPIHLLQQMKYMDEEVADPQSQGIEYTKIDQFYKWLTTHCKYLDCKYYELLVPFPKCIRIMRIRRHDKYRGNNRWEKEENRKNRKTIVIIRNGENIYAIDSKLTFERKLFPDQDELMNLYEELEQETFKESKQEAIDKTVHHYKSGMILMQGLIDRTEVFGNQFGKISFLNNKSAEEGKVVFKYEIDDNLIGDGTETFLDFLNKNELKKGDRVLVRYRNDNWHDIQSCLYKVYFKSDYCDIPPPEDGVYKIEWDKEYKCFYFRYNPKDKIWKRA